MKIIKKIFFLNEDHGIWSLHFTANRCGNNGSSNRLYFLGLQNHCVWWLQLWNERHLLFAKKAMTNLESILKSRDITLLTKVYTVKVVVFHPSSHVWMWELDNKEGWASKNWCFQTVVLEKTFVSPLDSKEIKPANPKDNQHCIFNERTIAPILWLLDAKSQLTGKDPDAWNDC